VFSPAQNLLLPISAERFEELQILKFAWQHQIIDKAGNNSKEVEMVDQSEDEVTYFKELLEDDEDFVAWVKQDLII
jgi:hypothetical protein